MLNELWSDLQYRLRALFRRGNVERELDAELRFHLDREAEKYQRLGLSRSEAQRRALVQFGGIERTKEESRDARGTAFLESFAHDLGYALRGLRARPGFAALAILTLALGIGAATSVFSVVDGVLLESAPYPAADRIVHLGTRELGKTGPGTNTSVDDYRDWARLSRAFSAMGVMMNASATLTGQGDAERVGIALVSSAIVDVFQVRPYLGRRIADADCVVGAPPVALLSYAFWQSRFGGDSAIVGRTIRLNSSAVQIVGVLPPRFAGPGRLNRPIWSNFTSFNDGRMNRSESVWALLRPGVAVADAQAEMTRIGAQLAAINPADNGQTVVVDQLADVLVGDLARPLYLLLAASLLVLLIACANLSNLLLARGTARAREIAVRAAIGASRNRIARQLLTESAVLAGVAGVVGVLIAWGVVMALVAMGPDVFRVRQPTVNLHVLGTALGLAAVTTFLVGLVPALRMAPGNPQYALRAAGTGTFDRRATRARNVLAVAQLALAVVLLSATALVTKSFLRVLRVEPGIRADHLLTANVSLPQGPRFDGLASTSLFRELMTRIGAIPGVASVAVTNLVPFSGDQMLLPIGRIRGRPERTGAAMWLADRYIVSPAYFATMGVRLLKGRVMTDADRSDAPAVCVVDEVFARRAFGTADPVGEHMLIAGRQDFARIVGVVAHVKTYGLDTESAGQIYVSHEQYPWRWSSLVIRTGGDPTRIAPEVRRVVRELDASQPVTNVATMEALMTDMLSARRFTLTLLAAFGATAIALATIGLYSVMAYAASQRRREFGVRMALGAQRTQIARMVLLEGGRIAAAGTLIGLLSAVAASRFIEALLFEVSARDWRVFAVVAASLAAVPLIACLAPAYKATSESAVDVLRGE